MIDIFDYEKFRIIINHDILFFQGANECQKKGVFVVSSPLNGVTKHIIQDVVTQSQFQYVVVMTTVSPLLHIDIGAPETESETVFEEFEEEVQQWMGNMVISNSNLFLVVLCTNRADFWDV